MKAVSPPSVGNSTAEGAERKPSSICATPLMTPQDLQDAPASERPACPKQGFDGNYTLMYLCFGTWKSNSYTRVKDLLFIQSANSEVSTRPKA